MKKPIASAWTVAVTALAASSALAHPGHQHIGSPLVHHLAVAAGIIAASLVAGIFTLRFLRRDAAQN